MFSFSADVSGIDKPGLIFLVPELHSNEKIYILLSAAMGQNILFFVQ